MTPSHVERARQRSRRFGRPRGFTLVEAMVTISITALAGSLILLAVETTVQTTNDSVEETIALGLARQLSDEISGRRYFGLGDDPRRYPLGPSAWEAQGTGRERYDDVGDYGGYSARPPQDARGRPVGSENDSGGLRPVQFQTAAGYFDKWRQRVEVFYVNERDLTERLAAGQTSNYRGVEIIIERVEADGAVRPLATINRVFAYVPTLP